MRSVFEWGILPAYADRLSALPVTSVLSVASALPNGAKRLHIATEFRILTTKAT